MGIKERRERERQITREAIVTAALAIAKRDGWAAVTIRKVGEQIEYSAPMVYEYFSSKEAMLLELAHQGFQQLSAAMEQAASTSTSSQRRLYDVASAYWDFGVANPELYQLMHGSSEISPNKLVLFPGLQEACAIAEKALVVWAGEHNIAVQDSYGATELVWCLLHGFTTLYLLKRLVGDQARAKALLDQALQAQLFAWETKQQVL